MRVYTVQGGSVTNVSGTVLISTVQQLPFIEVPEGYEDSAEVKELLVNKMFQELLEIF